MEKETRKLIEILKKGQIVLMPTDTVWGIAACYDNEQAIAKIAELKKRPVTKLMPIIVANNQQRDLLVEKEKELDAFLEKTKKPTTIIYRKKKTILRESPIWKGDSLAIRIVEAIWLKKILEKTGPLVATSLNKEQINFANKETKLTTEAEQKINFIYGSLPKKLIGQASQIFDWQKKKWLRR